MKKVALQSTVSLAPHLTTSYSSCLPSDSHKELKPMTRRLFQSQAMHFLYSSPCVFPAESAILSKTQEERADPCLHEVRSLQVSRHYSRINSCISKPVECYAASREEDWLPLCCLFVVFYTD